MTLSKKVLIVEDEPIVGDDVAMCLEQMGHMVVDICNSADKALSCLQERVVDLILLDIKINGEMDGIQLALIIRQQFHKPFIFISSLYDQTTIARARHAEPQGFVVKPFKDQDIIVAVEMAIAKSMMEPVNEPSKRQLNHLFIRKNQSIVPLDYDSVLYVEASDNYSIFHTHDGKHVVSQTLKHVEEVLQKQGYSRIHKTYLINLRKVDRIEQSVVFINGVSLPIGKVYKKALMERLTIM